MLKQVYVVLGMHRSNTSLVSGCLHACGVNFGSNLLPPTSDNETGYWKMWALNVIHDELLNSFGLQWSTPGRLPGGWLDSEFAASARRQLIEVMQGAFPDNNPAPIAIKDPRMCRFVPLWRQVFHDLGWSPEYLLVMRHPASVSASLVKRDELDPAAAAALWWVHNASVAKDLELSEHPLVVSGETFLNDPIGGCESILKRELNSLERDDVASLCKPDLQHHRQDSVPGGGDLYERFHELILTDWDKAREMAVFGLQSWSVLEAREHALSRREKDVERKMSILRDTAPNSYCTIFWPDRGGNFSGADSRDYPVPPFVWIDVRFDCPVPEWACRYGVRFDPVNAGGLVEIASCGWDCGHDVPREPIDPGAVCVAEDAIGLREPGRYLVVSCGNDPIIFLPGPQKGERPLSFCVRIRYRPGLSTEESELVRMLGVLPTRIQEIYANRFRATYLRSKDKSPKDVSLDQRKPEGLESLKVGCSGERLMRGIDTILNRKLFDYTYYLVHNPDIDPMTVEPLLHYLQHGWREGRNPSMSFSVSAYLRKHAEVKREGREPLLHYAISCEHLASPER